MEEHKEKWYKTGEASKEFGISQSALSRAIRMGKLKSSKITGHSPTGFVDLIPESALIEYMKNKKERVTTIKGVSEMTIDDISEEILKRINDAYQRGFKDGMAKAKAEYMSALKGVKL